MIMCRLIKVLLLLCLVFTMSEAKHYKCELVICPPCDFQSSETYSQYALRILNGKGPADGSCKGDSVKYTHKGEDYGLSHNACCCISVIKTTNVECKPRKPDVPECPDNIGIGMDEVIADYYKRVSKIQNDAPENGCCRDGTYKYIFSKHDLGTKHNTCACFVNDAAFIPEEACSD